MELSAAGYALLKRSEGFRSHVYLDVAGLPTIGYGHRLRPAESFPNGVTESTADAMLESDVNDAKGAVERLVKVQLSQGQFDALVDFVFNLGAARLAGSTLLKDLNAGRYDDAVEQLQLWDHTGGEVNDGLKSRREAEAALWRGEEAA
jgi:lysozyme